MLRLIPLFLLGAFLGFCLFLLLPMILTAWLTDRWASVAGVPYRCDGGNENLSPSDGWIDELERIVTKW